jgi:cytochrome P450
VNDDTVRELDDGDNSPEALKQRFGRDIFRDFDIDDPGFNEHFFKALELMARKCPVVRSNVGEGYWMVTRQEEIRRIGQDWRTFTSAKGYLPNRPPDVPFFVPEEVDPPIHSAWRRVLNPFFGPRAIAQYEQAFRADANTLIDRFIDRQGCEFISEFSSIFPGWAIFKNILAVPLDMLEGLVRDAELAMFGSLEKRKHYMQEVYGRLEAFMRHREREPVPGDLIDTIVRGVEYPDGTLSPWKDRVGVVVDLVFGGLVTTTYVMSGAVHHLAMNPGERQMLLNDLGLVENAIEEYVRVYSPVVAPGRVCTRDVEVAGVKMKEGDFVLLGFAASSRDPAAIENPAKTDIARKSNHHIAFGAGPHRCIGSNLARLELRVALEEWLKRVPDFSIKPGSVPTHETSILRSMTSLHVVIGK